MGLVKMYIKHQEVFKAFLNKNVFSLDLKLLKLTSSLIVHGNLFQCDGAAAVNALPPPNWPGFDSILCGLSLLLVLVPAPRVFLRVL